MYGRANVLRASAVQVPLKLVSRGLPSFVSSGTASLLNSSDYANPWQSSALPATGAIDISTVRSAITLDGSSRAPMVVSLSNGFTNFYTSTTSEEGNLTTYTIEVNAAASAGSAPTTGWTTVATVTGNVFACRSHLVDVAGKNWVRVNCSGTNNPTCKMDLFDASGSALSDFSAVKAGHLLIGDSITHFGLALDPQGLPGSPLSIGDQAKALLGTAYTPLTINAGMPGWDISTGDFGWLKLDGALSRFENVVATFPGKWVHVLLGTNDSNNGFSYATYYTSGLVLLKNICVTYGKTMVAHTTPWGSLAGIVAGRAPIDQGNSDIVTNFPGTVIAGADRFAYFNANQSLIGGDGVHPTGDGYVGQRSLVAARIAAFGAGA